MFVIGRLFARRIAHCGALALVVALAAAPAPAQSYLTPLQLDDLVARIALYPDPLLAQVLTASTYYDQIADASRWADGHSYLHGSDLARAISEDNLPWDPSVQALLPFPSVLDNMDRDRMWTHDLGEAVLAQRVQVMDAVQRMRRQAYDYGYIRDCLQYHVVRSGPVIELVPMAPGVVYVPVYDPYWARTRPAPGVTLSISFGPRIAVGPVFAPYGWREPRCDWRERVVIIDNRRWDRTVVNRNVYVHPYVAPLAVHNTVIVNNNVRVVNNNTRVVNNNTRVVERTPEPHVEHRDEARPAPRPDSRPEARPEARHDDRQAYRESHDVRPTHADRDHRRDDRKAERKDDRHNDHHDERR